eukprot:CAMPEP_0116131636 /NCGR_PEP_ID=MMETSP0329-20121206/9114_1 /TAXON_ID=697910 /ORGANISM="Pseudo-nitzschia arenysensis, Strain B593" /LENGTH=614 /DNA_ID=CAMNT_0003626085 /DNA_START=99 /DNA_END=1943 /DNA_ORIENTATION=-
MDSMEELVINTSSTEDSQGSGRSTSSYIWPFSSIMGGSSAKDSPQKKTKTPKKSSSRRSFGGNKNKQSHTSTNNSNIVPLVDEKFTVDRFQHDLEQAKMMRKAMDKRKQQQREEKQVSERKEPTESEVRLGLDGLDEAVVLRRMGRTEEALDISELSIELLIGYLRSDPDVLDIPGLSRNLVGVRIQNGLTLAEEMKSELTRNGSSRQSQKQPKPLKSIVNSITEMLESANEDKITPSSKKKQSASTTTKKKTKTAKNTTSKQIPSSRVPAKNKSTTITRKSSLNRTKVSAPTKTAVNRNTVAAPSPFANSQDPLVKTIKSDLYIDPSNLHSTTWNDIAGLKDAKQALQEAAILPLMRPDLFSGLRRPRNILLYGPPGTGKTLLVKAVAHESSCVLFVCTASAMTSKWHGEGEKLLRTLFQVARAAAPSIVFVDEMDALLSSRKSDGEHEASRRFKTEFMTNMDGIVKNGGDENGKHLLVIAATNCPWDIDSAVLRRFPRRIYVPLPDQTTRTALLQNLLEKAGDMKLSKADVKAVVKRLDGFSGSDIASIASEASFGPIRSLGGIDAIQAASSSDIRPIQRQDFDKAIDQATKSVSKTLLKQYDQWKQEQAAS